MKLRSWRRKLHEQFWHIWRLPSVSKVRRRCSWRGFWRIFFTEFWHDLLPNCLAKCVKSPWRSSWTIPFDTGGARRLCQKSVDEFVTNAFFTILLTQMAFHMAARSKKVVFSKINTPPSVFELGLWNFQNVEIFVRLKNCRKQNFELGPQNLSKKFWKWSKFWTSLLFELEPSNYCCP